MPRGGKRQGKPGASYGNRTDLNAQPVRTATGQAYGTATAQAAAQQQMPLAQQPAPPAAAAAPGQPPAPAPQLGGLYNQSMREDEPLQAGLDGAMTSPSGRDLLLALYRQFPNPDLAEAIERLR